MKSVEAFKARATALLHLQAARKPTGNLTHIRGEEPSYTPEQLEKIRQLEKRYATANAEYERIRNEEMQEG